MVAEKTTQARALLLSTNAPPSFAVAPAQRSPAVNLYTAPETMAPPCSLGWVLKAAGGPVGFPDADGSLSGFPERYSAMAA